MSAATIAKERDLEQLHLVLGFPGIPLGDPDYYAASVLSTAFGGGMSSRLFQEVRENRGLVYAIHSFAHSYRDGGLFGIYAGTGEEEAAELMPVLCDEAMRLEDGLAPGELARAKAQMKAGLLMSLESTGARCEQMAQHMLVHGTPFDPADIVRHIEAVDDAAIARVVARWRGAMPTLAALGPLGRLEDFERLRAGSAPEPTRRNARWRRSETSRACFWLDRSRLRLVGDRVFLRPPERGDYEAWASLRARSRGFSRPWEPTWPPDALSRSSYRPRLSRYSEDWRTDQGYNFFIFRNEDEALAGGVGLSNIRRGVAETASLGYWIGEPFARQRYMSAALPLVLDFAFDPAAAAPRRGGVPAEQRAEPRPVAAHRFPAGGLRPPLPADRREMAGPPALRDPARGLARLSPAARNCPLRRSGYVGFAPKTDRARKPPNRRPGPG